MSATDMYKSIFLNDYLKTYIVYHAMLLCQINETLLIDMQVKFLN